jgi:hypothetical protein
MKDLPTIIEDLKDVLRDNPWKVRDKLVAYVAKLEAEQPKEKTRTDTQNRALHKFFTMLSDTLNLMGLEMRIVLKPSYKIWWSPESVKEHLWRPLQKAKLGITSTKDLKKQGDIDLVHEELMRLLGETHNVEYIEFPHDKTKDQDYKTEARKLQINYPNE